MRRSYLGMLTLILVAGAMAPAAAAPSPPPISLVYSRGPQGWVVGERLVLMSGPRHRTRVFPVPRRSADTEPSWSPDGHRIAFTRTVREGEDNWPASLWAMRADGGDARLLALSVDAWSADLEPDWSPDGTWIAFRRLMSSPGIATGVHLIHPDGSGEETLIAPGGAPDWRRDGEALAFVRWSAPDVTWGPGREIFTVGSDGTGVVQITDDPADDFDPVWSPDGSRLAFVSDRAGNPDIWLMDPDGGNPIRVTRHPAPDQDPTWSPNGKWLAFTSTRVAPDPFDYNASTDIFLIRADGEGVRRITYGPAVERDPDWRPAP